MFSRLIQNREYTLDSMMKKLEDPIPIAYGDHVVIIDRADGLYYVLECVKDSIITYPVFYCVKKVGHWNRAIQSLILFDKDV